VGLINRFPFVLRVKNKTIMQFINDIKIKMRYIIFELIGTTSKLTAINVMRQKWANNVTQIYWQYIAHIYLVLYIIGYICVGWLDLIFDFLMPGIVCAGER